MLDQKLSSQKELEFALFELNKQYVAIKLDFLEKFNLINEIIKIPRAPKFILGVIRIEKAIIPLLDLEILLGKKKPDHHNSVALVISLEDNIFAIHINNVPKVQKFDELVEKLEDDLDLNFPKEWVTGYLKTDKFIPIIDPNRFWVGLGDNEISGPSLNYYKEEDGDEQ